MFDGAVPYMAGKITDYLKESAINFIVDYITVFPLLAAISIGVYALISMISRRLASLGVIGVFIYGALVVIA